MIVSTYWNGNRGAVTWGSGITGISGTVSEANSLVGSNPDDRVGWANILTRGVIPLSNGNYLVESRFWNGNRGAVTWGNGYTGVIGIVSAANSLVGSTPSGSDPGDSLDLSVATLNNGNYVVIMPYWNADRGAVTWGSGTTGVSGTISEANSLVGSDPGDQVGGGLADGYLGGVIPLSNGDYVVQSPDWNHDRGAVTWVNGSIGIGAKVSDANSLVGSNPGDYVGSDGLTFVGNGNYVIHSPLWNGYRGAATWVDGSTGLSGIVSTDNSLVGTNPRHGLAGYNSGDMVGSDIIPLSNGNYVVGSSTWNGGRGAVTWANGRTGITGTITAANSLVGNIPGDYVGQLLIIAFPNGNYLVVSTSWHSGRGAVTWGNGNTGVSGIVSAANSLVGSSPPEVGFGDQVGSGGITFLNNGNYVVSSPAWNSGHGAFTWGNGSAGVSGTVSAANSLVDGNAESKRTRIIPLSNGNYVVNMPDWNGTRGAVTWGNGTTGVSGIISDANSLVGDNPGDHVGAFNSSPLAMVSLVPWNGVIPLSNGNYVVTSPDWNGFRGAVTWGNGSTGIEGKVSDANSLVGSKVGDKVGADLITPLSNGNYVVSSSGWNGYRGAVTWGDGGKGTSGIVSDANSLVGSYPDDLVGGYGVAALSNGDYAFRCPSWNDNRGAVTWGDGSTGSSGTVSEVNSLVGANLGDRVGSEIIPLSNGNYVVESPSWNGFRGALTWCNGSGGFIGTVSDANSLAGRDPWDGVGGDIVPLSDGNYIVLSEGWNGGRGAVTWVSGSSGQTLDGLGMITPQNSLVGSAVDGHPDFVNENPTDQTFLTTFDNEQGGRVTVGYTDPSRLTYAVAQFQALAITPAFLTRTLDTGTAVVLQASNDITVNSPITVSAGGHGGALTLQAGRSLLLNAPITTDNGDLTLIANDQLANGVVDSQRDPGNAVISMAADTALDTGSGKLRVELRDGAGLTNQGSGSITLQTVTAGSAIVINNGTSAGSDVSLGPVRTTGPQSFSNPNGTTRVAGNLTTTDNPITFNHSVVLNAGLTLNVGSSAVNFAAGTLSPTPGLVTVVGGVVLAGPTTVSATLNGSDPGSYSQLAAGGPISLGGSTLNLVLGFEPPVGSSFEILTTTGSGPIIGTFKGLDEGAVFSQGGYQFQITYQGGSSGRSVVLTRLA